MKRLVVTAYPPGEEGLGGGGWVDRGILRQLDAELVTVTGAAGQWTSGGFSGSSAGEIPLEVRSSKVALLKIAASMLRSPEPYLARKFTTFPGWGDAVRLLREKSVGKEVITSGWPSLLLAVAAGVPVKAHIAHNVESAIANEHSPLPLRLLGEPARLNRLERRILRVPSQVHVLSRLDAHRLWGWGIPAKTLPLPVADRSVARNPSAFEGVTVGFLGKASWPPNASALAILLGEVSAGLGDNVRFFLAGKGTEEFAEHPRVWRSGFLERLEDFYAEVDLVVVPRFGNTTGVSVKLLEAAEHGVPALTSTDLALALDPTGPWLQAPTIQALTKTLQNIATGTTPLPNPTPWLTKLTTIPPVL